MSELVPQAQLANIDISKVVDPSVAIWRLQSGWGDTFVRQSVAGALYGTFGAAATTPNHGGLWTELVRAIKSGWLALVARRARRQDFGITDPEDTAVPLAYHSGLPLAELNEEQTEGPVHVLVRIYYDPDRPEAWDDKLRLFTTDNDGGTYDNTVDLTSEADTQRDERHLLVLFRDIVPQEAYSCFLDLGQTEGGYLLFYKHKLSRLHHVEGLPKNT